MVTVIGLTIAEFITIIAICISGGFLLGMNMNNQNAKK